MGSKDIIVYLDVTAGSSGALQLQIQSVDYASGAAFNLTAAPTAVNATGKSAYVLGPACSSATGDVVQATQGFLPSQFQIYVAGGSSAHPMTYSVGYDFPSAHGA